VAENSKIEWTDHTFNPWVGCTKVSPACDHCYAEGWAKRTGQAGLWNGERRRTSAANWRLPYKWNNAAPLSGPRPRVFCASLADVFDNQAAPEWRRDLWWLIRETPNLDWLLLTKRPQNIVKMLPDNWGEGYPNVWLGTTVENQTEADRRIVALLEVPAVIHFLSCEPLLGPLDLNSVECGFGTIDALDHEIAPGIDWVIVGGESGPGARPFEERWAQQLKRQCEDALVPFFMKQMSGVRKPLPPIPQHLMLRQFPAEALAA
jgi:protein gp37